MPHATRDNTAAVRQRRRRQRKAMGIACVTVQVDWSDVETLSRHGHLKLAFDGETQRVTRAQIGTAIECLLQDLA